MKRKEFFIISGRYLFGGFLAFTGLSCTSTESPETPDEEQTFTSTTSQNHTHSVTIQRSEIENPPEEGITKTTSTSSGHSHNFSMTRQQLLDVQNDQTVTITDSLAAGHTHDYEIEKWY